ncbi:MAG: site-2 protease family protein [Bdellovibrionales bacterium]|nr:site-2 protease family protein [Bdellovibrionales bacterium]
MDFVEIGAKLAIYFIPFLFALCFHEFAHGYVAKMRGDRTAELSGRLSLNPMVHADPIGTWLLPILAIAFSSPFFFGWAKPVPVNSRNLMKPKWDMFWVALAGPMSNVFLALVATIGLGVALAYGSDPSGGLIKLLGVFLSVNLFLAVFNLIPIHPLDGGKVIEPFLPYSWNRWLEENQAALNMGLLLVIFMGGPILAVPVHYVSEKLLYVSALIGHSLL